MAKSCSIISTAERKGRHLILTCSQTQDVVNNRSLITWTLSVSGGEYHYYATGPTRVWINGVNVYIKERLDAVDVFPASDKQPAHSDNIYVNHNTDGSKTINIKLKTAIWNSTEYEDSINWQLDPIARASIPTLSKNNFSINETSVVYSNRKSTSFSHQLYFKYPDGGYGNPLTSFNDSYVFNPKTSFSPSVYPLGMLSFWNNSFSYSGTFLLRTMNGTTTIGDKLINFTVTIPNYEVSDPIINNYSLSNTYNVSGNNYIIDGYSRLSISFTPGDWQYNASFKKCYITLVNITNPSTGDHIDIKRLYEGAPPIPSSNIYTITSLISGIDFGNDSTKMCGVKLSIEDSRGKIKDYLLRNANDSSQYYIMNVYKHISPTIQGLNIYRCSSSGVESKVDEYVDIILEGIIHTNIIGYTLTLSYKLNSSNFYSKFIKLERQSVTPTWQLNTYYSSEVLTDPENENQYLVTSKPSNWDNSVTPSYINYCIKCQKELTLSGDFDSYNDGGITKYRLKNKLFNIIKMHVYDFKIEIKDSTSGGFSGKSTEYGFTIGSGKIDFHLTPSGAGFGMYHDPAKEGVIESDWDLEIKGRALLDIIYPVHSIFTTRSVLDDPNNIYEGSSWQLDPDNIGDKINGTLLTKSFSNSWTNNSSITLSPGTYMLIGYASASQNGSGKTIRLSSDVDYSRQSFHCSDGNVYSAQVIDIVKPSVSTTYYLQSWSAQSGTFALNKLSAYKLFGNSNGMYNWVRFS